MSAPTFDALITCQDAGRDSLSSIRNFIDTAYARS
jgi:hypothetical protein